jgi:4'-phosphopantetheinyl transferase
VLAELESLLDDDERRRVEALRRPQLRRRFVAAHGAVRVIVGEYLGAAPEHIRWRTGRHGKPELAGAVTGRQVNLSHSDDLAVVAVAEQRPVGVDIQRLPPSLDVVRMAARFYPEPETRFVASARTPAAQADRFVRLWARKEACVKAAGGRLMEGMPLPVRGGLDRLPATGALVCDPTGTLPGQYLVRDVPVPPGFRAAVALAGTRPYRVVRHRYSPPTEVHPAEV